VGVEEINLDELSLDDSVEFELNLDEIQGNEGADFELTLDKSAGPVGSTNDTSDHLFMLDDELDSDHDKNRDIFSLSDEDLPPTDDETPV